MKKNFLRTSNEIKRKKYILNEEVDGSIHASRLKTFLRVTPTWLIFLFVLILLCLLAPCIAVPIILE